MFRSFARRLAVSFEVGSLTSQLLNFSEAYLPTGLFDPRYHALIGIFTETDSAETEVSHEGSLTTATKAAPYDAAAELGLLLSPCVS